MRLCCEQENKIGSSVQKADNAGAESGLPGAVPHSMVQRERGTQNGTARSRLERPGTECQKLLQLLRCTFLRLGGVRATHLSDTLTLWEGTQWGQGKNLNGNRERWSSATPF